MAYWCLATGMDDQAYLRLNRQQRAAFMDAAKTLGRR